MEEISLRIPTFSGLVEGEGAKVGKRVEVPLDDIIILVLKSKKV